METAINQYIKTHNGLVHIESNLTADRFHDLIFVFDLPNLSENKAIYSGKQILEHILKKGVSIALALLNNKTIVGYAILDYPNAEDRWAGLLNGETVMELKAVEVLREFRNHGIARRLLGHLFFDIRLDKKIVYLTAY
ncbi:MAG: GNAT family N-acetyltransferase [Proteobacteria bacterium]|nr:GNAT family N-acetyltransferase [Pseudomonadota bacterium]MBU1586179.1 GNAT family N-acetyltransferase [Pseudomonadota bacterium]MBU2453050.1 GNAT family N-acetyltransferase [Pseudomonadota bacterium]MBU2631994.1 GNAT family N-acetyltransferase [Pseudomonadota bacterium]